MKRGDIMNLADNLKKIRKDNNLSQEQLAEKLGVSRQSVSKWENGEAYPEMNNILELCKIFNCKINDLIHTDMSDISSLDEEIIMNVVKFNDKKQQQVKTLSNVIGLIGKIGSIVLKVAILGFLVFFVSYFLSLFIAKDGEANIDAVIQFIVNIFVHYFVSGVLGWSQDLQAGILEVPNFDVLIINVLNIVSLFTGDEFINAINPVFIHNGINGSNVRSFFGTIYINSNIFPTILL